jgi:predicted RNase H-like HicB family nuclease
MKDNYPIVVFWSDEDESWIADVPDLHSLSAHGETAEEAVRELMIAREAWLEVVREYGHTLPDPDDSRFWPDIARKQRDHQRSLTAMPPAGAEAAEVA